ncbi:ATP-binding protein [Flavobacteriaceae bacterium]|jgi:hypothetical protein|nr:ATP-binding protein [Flavobacteriaceae bacterium]
MIKTIECNPNVSNFTKSFKNIGYNHYTAILDIIDNSISAKATKVWIEYTKDTNNSLTVVIADNGFGMDREGLIEAMRIASSDPTLKRNDSDLGKFGLGMKLASFSQTDKFSVISKTKKQSACSFTWDLNYIRIERKWLLQEENLSFLKPKEQGTEVVLYNVLEGENIDESDVLSKMRTHISVAYNLIRDVKFYINDKEINLIDPFFSQNIASNHSNIENIYIDNIILKVQSHQIPHSSKLKPKEKRVKNELTEIGMGPGLYIYRKNRLIAWSGWEGLGNNLRINDLFRVAIFCEDNADELFNIEVKKSQISITDKRIRNKLRNSILNYTEIARKPYKRRAHLSLKDLSDLWYLKKNESGKITFELNKKSHAIKLYEKEKIQLSQLLEMIENTLPYESLMYYLNLNKVDNVEVNNKKLETAKIMFDCGLINADELKKLKRKYES